MYNLQNIVDEQFVEDLLQRMHDIGVARKTVMAIFVEGSALYLANPNDIDFKVIVAWHNPKAEIGRSFTIKGYRVECTYYRLTEWNNVDKGKRIFYYVTESPDMILVYGSEVGFKRFDIVADRELARKVYGLYDKYLFNYEPPTRPARRGTAREQEKNPMQMPPKRLWNFLLFAYKLYNNSHTLTEMQLQKVQDAHDCKSTLEDYRGLFVQLGEMLLAD